MPRSPHDLPRDLARLGFAERLVHLDGVTLNVCEGPNNGPPVVLVPGQTMPWRSYQRLLPRIAGRTHAFAIDVRGHGRSPHTPGVYSFSRLGADLVEFLRRVVPEPAVLTGNSSGGVIALWAAAHAPDRVRAVLAEDPPLFSSEWPRMRDEPFMHGLFRRAADTLSGPGPRDVSRFFEGFSVPVQGRDRVMDLPRPIAWVLGGAIRRAQRQRPGEPVDLAWLPLHLRLFVRGLSEYDPDFSAACADGRMCDVDHAAMLAAIRCPVVLLHANWFRHPTLGLVGAMDDHDVARAREALPSLQVQRWRSAHVMHIADPRRFAEALLALCGELQPKGRSVS